MQRWVKREAGRGRKSAAITSGLGCTAASPLPEIPDEVGAELLQSMVGRERAMQAENHRLRQHVAKLEADLASGAASLDTLRVSSAVACTSSFLTVVDVSIYSNLIYSNPCRG